MSILANIGGVWKTVSGVWVNVGGVWRKAPQMYAKVGGVWKPTLGPPDGVEYYSAFSPQFWWEEYWDDSDEIWCTQIYYNNAFIIDEVGTFSSIFVGGKTYYKGSLRSSDPISKKYGVLRV